MANFTKTAGRLSIVEERKFTNPHVRFVRIRGRIVPILNKKRIGQTLSSTGTGLITVGAVLSGPAAIQTVFRIRKSKRVKKILANPRTARIFKASIANATMFKQSRFTGLGLSKFGKRSLLTGLALGTAGLVAGAVGFQLQARSPLGADL